ncbi:hypothetical protein ACVJGD_008543 [Bradyrhizobium sp. USDA 10063]
MRDAHRELSLQTNPDKATLRVRGLARLAAREDYERELDNRRDKESDEYARFSTDLQNERSIEDQLSLCQSNGEREGLTVVSTYEDRVRSGGSVMGREGLLRMLDQARGRSLT